MQGVKLKIALHPCEDENSNIRFAGSPWEQIFEKTNNYSGHVARQMS